LRAPLSKNKSNPLHHQPKNGQKELGSENAELKHELTGLKVLIQHTRGEKVMLKT